MSSAILVAAVMLLATTVRSAFGFGEALIAVPLLALAMPVATAAPLAVLASITVAAIILIQDWREVHFHSAGRLLLWTLLGIPFGLLLLKLFPERAAKGLLAGTILFFSARSFRSSGNFSLRDDRRLWLFGLAAGVLGGAYGINGPPLAVYGSLRGWSRKTFRATLQGYFLPASLAGMFGFWCAGLWTARVDYFYLRSLPEIIAGVALGGVINRRLEAERFRRAVQLGLGLIGLLLLIQAAFGPAKG